MFSSIGSPHFFQGPENFPAEGFMTYYTNLAKNGAAVVTFIERADDPVKKRGSGLPDHMRSQNYDMTDPSVENYLSRLAEDIHFYGSKIAVRAEIGLPKGYRFSPKPEQKPVDNNPSSEIIKISMDTSGKEATPEILDEAIDKYIEKIKLYQSLGFDMLIFYVDLYLSPFWNLRSDEYGGSLENRAGYPLKVCKRIKEELGNDFLITGVLRGEEHKGGLTLEDTIVFTKMAEGLIDILELREKDGALGHPTGFNSSPDYHETIRYAEAVKKSGAKIIVMPNAGFQNLDQNEDYIASGKADMISMVRAFICDPEYGLKAYEGRGEDVVPCIRCNKCHGVMKAPWLSFCSVNPTIGIAHTLHRMVLESKTAKKVAVIGGGPAGMEAAMIAAKRGHKVTLYEKDKFLGGQMIHANYASFKWPIKHFKNYLIFQLEKLGVEVCLNTFATPEMIKEKGYDTVLAALGAEPNYPEIAGINENNVFTWVDVYGKEQNLGKNVVVIGGSEIGVETGMYLAENGHDVTVLTRQNQLAHNASPLHYITMAYMTPTKYGEEKVQAAWEKYDNFNYILQAKTTVISDGYVSYIDANGNENQIEADSVVVCGGMNSRQEEALKFYGSAERFYLIGDCDTVGNIQKCTSSAFAAASQI